jgi:hypothetical protein
MIDIVRYPEEYRSSYPCKLGKTKELKGWYKFSINSLISPIHSALYLKPKIASLLPNLLQL